MLSDKIELSNASHRKDFKGRRVVLITGANGALGMGIVQRLSDPKDPSSENLIFVMSTRSISKFEQAKAKILQEFPHARIEPLILDLCDTKSIIRAVNEIKQRYDHLDAVVCNAGMMPLERIDVWNGIKDFLTRPAYLAKTGGDTLVQRTGVVTKAGLGETFSANVFGHYILVRQLLPLLSAGHGVVVWFTSTTAIPEFFDVEDMQCIHGSHPYESSKRLCELLVRAWGPLLQKQGIHSYVVSPGNFQSGIVGGAISSYILIAILYLMRLMCLSGINVTGTNAATSTVHILQSRWNNQNHDLDPNVVYHSEINIFGRRWASTYPIQSEDEWTLKAISEKMSELYATHVRE